jgi:hypothetical protein
VKAEEPLGEHGEQDETGRKDGLDDRQRCECKGADVKAPGSDRHQPADREPLGAKEPGGASQRMADVDRSYTTAPRYFNRKATLVANADASASGGPRIIRPNGDDPVRSPAPLDGSAPDGR